MTLVMEASVQATYSTKPMPTQTDDPDMEVDLLYELMERYPEECGDSGGVGVGVGGEEEKGAVVAVEDGLRKSPRSPRSPRRRGEVMRRDVGMMTEDDGGMEEMRRKVLEELEEEKRRKEREEEEKRKLEEEETRRRNKVSYRVPLKADNLRWVTHSEPTPPIIPSTTRTIAPPPPPPLLLQVGELVVGGAIAADAKAG